MNKSERKYHSIYTKIFLESILIETYLGSKINIQF